MKRNINIYIGNGKAKTTTAFGIAVRALGAGRRVFIAQILNGIPSFETESIQNILPNFELKQYCLERLTVNIPNQKEIEAVHNFLTGIEKVIVSGNYDVVILDKLCIIFDYNLLIVNEFINILKSKPTSMEIVITCSYLTEELIEIADSVTEMKEINFA